MIATLTMYDLPELRAATDAWWAGLAKAFRNQGIDPVPDVLSRDGIDDPWGHTLFGQTCGYPLTHALQGRVRVIATPAYDCPGCDGSDYCSLLIVRKDDPAVTLADLRGRKAAINSTDSQSGYSALRGVMAPLAKDAHFFSAVVESGGHHNSLALVADGRADICAVDCVTFALLAQERPALAEDLRSLAETPKSPGLPYVTHGAADDNLVSQLRNGLFAVLADPALDSARKTLRIAGAKVLAEGAYQRILDIEADAKALNYTVVN